MRYFIILIIIFFIGCSNKSIYLSNFSNKNNFLEYNKPYVVGDKLYFPFRKVYIGYTQTGVASWYGPNFHGKYTSNGEIYNMFAYTAAHKTLPMNTIVKVTNLNNGKSVIVRINDRGPFVKGRIIDLSYIAGKKIGLDKSGIAPVKIVVIGFGKDKDKYIFKNKAFKNKGYFIQIGAFLRKKSAIELLNKYKKFGYNTFLLRNNGFYKIYLGRFKTYSDAKFFQLKHKIAGFIVGELF